MADGSGEIDIRALPKMVRWYSPAHLVSTGWRSIVSEIFGQYADQRIMQATIDGFAPEIMKTVVGRYNYSDLRQLGDGNTVWVDYVADLGDGFDFTYAIASLISQPQIDLEGVGSLPAAKLLIMGGDRVYPFPTRTAYRERFAMPYSTALPPAPDGNWRRLLFVLPGNHDWYDGLSSFDHMFCKARFGHAAENRIGGWLCPQHRSYFAIRLPHNWWIWGADIQLAQYLDAGQVLYFQGVAEAMKQHPTEAPKLILCTAEPSWNYDKDEKLQGEDNLSTITKIATDAGARVAAVVAGDLHHYSRYFAKDVRHELRHRRRWRRLFLADALPQEHSQAAVGQHEDRPRSALQVEGWQEHRRAVLLALTRQEPAPQPIDTGVPVPQLRLRGRAGRHLLGDDLDVCHARRHVERNPDGRRRP